MIDRFLGDSSDGGDEEDGDEVDPAEAADEMAAELSEDLAGDGGADPFGAGDDAESDGPRPQDLARRIDDLEDRIERQTSAMEGVRSDQEDLVDRLDEVDDRIRRLLGVYDQLTEDVNPLVESSSPSHNGSSAGGNGQAHEPDQAGTAGEEFRFGVVGKHDTGAGTEDQSVDGDAVTFDDLVDDAAGEDGQTRADLPATDRDRKRDHDRPVAAPTGQPSPADGEASLSEVPDSYAADVAVYEWLTMLVTEGGPAATFRALRYYEQVGWLAPGVRGYLEDVLSGPALDVDVDPSRPGELGSAHHARSHEYVRKLDAIASLETEGL